MSKGGSDIQATFSVIGVPINNENLTSFTTQSATDNGTGTVNNTTGNTVDGNTVVDNTTNTTNTTNTADTANAVNASNTTNTTNSTNTAQKKKKNESFSKRNFHRGFTIDGCSIYIRNTILR